MSEPAAQLAAVIAASMPNWGGQCLVCDSTMYGMQQHLASYNHWKRLWSKLNILPLPDIAVDWARPWVEVFETTRGDYLFNHVTGQQCWRAEMEDGTWPPPQPVPPPVVQPTPPGSPESRWRAESETSPACAGPPELVRPAPPEAPPATISPLAEAASTCVARQEEDSRLDFWMFQRMVEPQAQRLEALLDSSTCHQNCAVCGVPFGMVCDHFLSERHHMKLRSKLQQMMGMWHTVGAAVNDGPWVQTFGPGVAFNHVTCQVLDSPLRRKVFPKVRKRSVETARAREM